MNTTPFSQARELIHRSNSIALAFPREHDEEVYGACGALFFALTKLGKKAYVYIPSSWSIPEKFTFLPSFHKIFKSLDRNELALSLPCSSLSSVRYEKTDGGIIFYIQTADESAPTKEELSLVCKPTQCDLLITLGAQTIEQLGELLECYPQLFEEVPILSIDHNPDHEAFGKVNIVSLQAISSTEVAKELIEKFDENLIDEAVATYLLCGMVLATKNFQLPCTTPQILLESASLIRRGANHQAIVQHLYKTKTLQELMFFGHVARNLREKGGLMWTSLSNKSLEEFRASSSEIMFVAEELKEHFLNPTALLLLWVDQHRMVNGLYIHPSERFLRVMEEKLHGVVKRGVLFFSLASSDMRLAEEKLVNFFVSNAPKIES